MIKPAFSAPDLVFEERDEYQSAGLPLRAAFAEYLAENPKQLAINAAQAAQRLGVGIDDA